MYRKIYQPQWIFPWKLGGGVEVKALGKSYVNKMILKNAWLCTKGSREINSQIS